MKHTTLSRFLKTRLALPGALFCAVVCGTALTANAGPAKNPVLETITAPFDWTGFYLGGNLGGILSDYEFNSHFSDLDVAQQFNDNVEDFVFDEPVFASFFSPHAHETTDGSIIGGGQVGYQHQIGNFVIGVEGDFQRTSSTAFTSHTDFDGNILLFPDAAPGGPIPVDEFVFAESTFVSERRAEMTWTASARGRLGWSFGHVQVYGTGGITWANIRATANDLATTDFFLEQIPSVAPQQNASTFIGFVTNSNVSQHDKTICGWTGGGGVDVAISDLVSVGLEYRHTDFGEEHYGFNSHDGPIFTGPTHIDLDSDQVTVRFNILLSHLFGH